MNKHGAMLCVHIYYRMPMFQQGNFLWMFIINRMNQDLLVITSGTNIPSRISNMFI